jgi:hypothetical protein
MVGFSSERDTFLTNVVQLGSMVSATCPCSLLDNLREQIVRKAADVEESDWKSE